MVRVRERERSEERNREREREREREVGGRNAGVESKIRNTTTKNTSK